MSPKAKPQPPTHGIYITPEGSKKGRWMKIGAAWMHKDGKGASLIFNAVPVGGRAVIRVFEEQDQAGDEFNDAAIGGQQ